MPRTVSVAVYAMTNHTNPYACSVPQGGGQMGVFRAQEIPAGNSSSTLRGFMQKFLASF